MDERCLVRAEDLVYVLFQPVGEDLHQDFVELERRISDNSTCPALWVARKGVQC